MFRLLIAGLFLAFAAISAHAVETINVTSQTCNVSNTLCVLQGDNGETFTVNPQTARMTVNDLVYTGSITSSVVVMNTNYRREYDVTFTFTPTATLDAVYISARSGSGRGGWAWHNHWVFTTITIY